MSEGQGKPMPHNLENFDGDLWRESIPHPFYGRKWVFLRTYVCWHTVQIGYSCQKQFRKPKDYYDHYAKEHADSRVWRRTPIGNWVRYHAQSQSTKGGINE